MLSTVMHPDMGRHALGEGFVAAEDVGDYFSGSGFVGWGRFAGGEFALDGF